MKYYDSLDSIRINLWPNHNRIIAIGWSLNGSGEIPQMELRVNGKTIKSTFKQVNRPDVIQRFNYEAAMAKRKNEDFVPPYDIDIHSIGCGYILTSDLIEADLNTVEIVAIYSNASHTVRKLNRRNIEKNANRSALLYNIDSIAYSKNRGVWTLTGWAGSILDEKVYFAVVDENNKQPEVTYTSIERPDLIEDRILTERRLKSGFKLVWNGDKQRKYYLIIRTDTCCVKLPCAVDKDSKQSVMKIIQKNFNWDNISSGLRYLGRNGIRRTIKKILYCGSWSPNFYDMWFRERMVTNEELQNQRKTRFLHEPKISLIVPTYNTPIKLLCKMVDTVRNQSYANWELCIADGSDKDHPARRMIEEYVSQDSRIKAVYLGQNYGISGNTNKAFELATGEYTAMYDHDDFLELNALYEVVKAINEHDADIVYTDEDKFSMKTKHCEDPNLKPDFSPDLLRSHNYITHLFVVKTEILRGVGGFDSTYDGAQDYDVILKCTEKTNKIYHLPKILYHWRMTEGSTAEDPESKLYAYEAGRKALAASMTRQGIKADVSMLPKPYYGLYHVKYDTLDNPLVSVVIPNYENQKVLKTCVNSLLNVNTYPNIEIIIVENNSKSPELFAWYKQIQQDHDNVHVVTWKGGEFNYSAINNFGVKYTKGKYILFLNNDTELINPDSIGEMAGMLIQREDVGVVGAKLLYQDNTIQHAGIIIGFGGTAGHVFNFLDENASGFMMRPLINCNYSAVTGACMMVKKELFEQVGGFEEKLAVAYNDVDLCLKIRSLDKLVVYNAFSLWYHYESISRGYETTPEKKARFKKEAGFFHERWKNLIEQGDPYYNPNFDIGYNPYELH